MTFLKPETQRSLNSTYTSLQHQFSILLILLIGTHLHLELVVLQALISEIFSYPSALFLLYSIIYMALSLIL